MTLNEAMILVLRKEGRPMTTREIADVINREHLYTRADKDLVPPSQISARMNHHLDTFERVGNKIKLI